MRTRRCNHWRANRNLRISSRWEGEIVHWSLCSWQTARCLLPRFLLSSAVSIYNCVGWDSVLPPFKNHPLWIRTWSSTRGAINFCIQQLHRSVAIFIIFHNFILSPLCCFLQNYCTIHFTSLLCEPWILYLLYGCFKINKKLAYLCDCVTKLFHFWCARPKNAHFWGAYTCVRGSHSSLALHHHRNLSVCLSRAEFLECSLHLSTSYSSCLHSLDSSDF